MLNLILDIILDFVHVFFKISDSSNAAFQKSPTTIDLPINSINMEKNEELVARLSKLKLLPRTKVEQKEILGVDLIKSTPNIFDKNTNVNVGHQNDEMINSKALFEKKIEAAKKSGTCKRYLNIALKNKCGHFSVSTPEAKKYFKNNFYFNYVCNHTSWKTGTTYNHIIYSSYKDQILNPVLKDFMIRIVKPNVNSDYLNTNLIRLPIRRGSSFTHKSIQILAREIYVKHGNSCSLAERKVLLKLSNLTTLNREEFLHNFNSAKKDGSLFLYKKYHGFKRF